MVPCCSNKSCLVKNALLANNRKWVFSWNKMWRNDKCHGFHVSLYGFIQRCSPCLDVMMWCHHLWCHVVWCHHELDVVIFDVMITVEMCDVTFDIMKCYKFDVIFAWCHQHYDITCYDVTMCCDIIYDALSVFNSLESVLLVRL